MDRSPYQSGYADWVESADWRGWDGAFIGSPALAGLPEERLGEMLAENGYDTPEVRKDLKKILDSAEDKEAALEAIGYVVEVGASARKALDLVRTPAEPEHYFIPVSPRLCQAAKDKGLQSAMQTIWKADRQWFNKKYGINMINVHFYDGKLDGKPEGALPNLEGSMESAVIQDLNGNNTVVFIDGVENSDEAVKKFFEDKFKDKIKVGIRPPNRIKEGLKDANKPGYLAVGGHIKLARGLLDFLRNGAEPNLWSDVRDLMEKLSAGQGHYEDIENAEALKKALIEGNLEIILPSAEAYNVDELIAVEQAVATAA